MTRFICYKCGKELQHKRSPIGLVEPYCDDCDLWMDYEWFDNPYLKDKIVLSKKDFEFLISQIDKYDMDNSISTNKRIQIIKQLLINKNK